MPDDTVTGRRVETREWYALDVQGVDEPLRYPPLPVDVFREHAQRHGDASSEIYEHRTDDDGTVAVWTRTVTAEGTVQQRDATLTYTVMNRVQREEDVLALEATFPDPERAPDDPDAYLGPIWDGRYGTQVADMEQLYERAKIAGYMVSTVQEKLNDDPRRTHALDRDAVVERARDRALDGYYDEMSMDTLAGPLAELLEGAHADREGLLAPFGHVFSGDAAERAKVEKGRVLIDTYYDVVADVSDALAEAGDT